MTAALNIDTSIGGFTAPAAGQAQQPAQAVSTPAAQPKELSWFDRAAANFRDAWRTGTLAGAATTAAQTSMGTEAEDAKKVEEERKRRAEFEAMPSWMDAPDAMGKLKEFSAMIAGQIAGGLASPESLVAAPAKGMLWAAQGASALSRAGRRAAVQGGMGAAVNTVADPAVQGLDIASGVQDEFSVGRAVAAPLIGAGLGGVAGAGGLVGKGETVRNAEDAIRVREAITGRKLEGWERQMVTQVAEVLRKHRKPEALEKYAGNLNLERIRAGEDVFKLIDETAETNRVALEAIRRGTISNDQLRTLASDLDMTPETLVAMSRPGAIVNAEQALAGRQIELDLAVDATAAAKLAAKEFTPENAAILMDTFDTFKKVNEAMSGFRAESGRLQQQFNIKVMGEDRARAIQIMMEQNPKFREDLQGFAAMVSSLDDPATVRRFLRKVNPSSTMEKLVEAWKAGLLTSIRTHGVNTVSNAAVNLLRVPTELMAAGIGQARKAVADTALGEKLDIDDKDGRSLRGAMARLKATFTSSNEQLGAWANFTEALRTAETPSVFGATNEVERFNAIGSKVGEAIRTPFRLLTAEDAFFKAVAARQELSAIAWDRLTKDPAFNALDVNDQVLAVNRFIANPPKDAMDVAVKYADELTFNKQLGAVGDSIQTMVNKVPALQFIVPFVRTPINIVKYGFEHTPLVVLNPNYRNLTGQAKDLAIAKAATGSTLMLGMYGLAQDGVITGSGPQDPAELMRLKETGWQPYSVKVGDTFVPYERIQPLGMLLGLAADMQYMMDEIPQAADARGLFTKDGEISAADMYAAYGIHIFMENVVNSTFTTQINNLFEALNDPTGNKVDNFINSFAGSMVPNIVADVAKAVDPTIRSAEGPMDAIKARIPGMSQDLPAARNWAGQERVREQGPVEQMISPFQTTTEKQDKAIREVARLNYSMPMVPKIIGNKQLSPEQRELFAAVAGQYRYNNITKVVNSPGYDKLASGPGGDEKVRRAFASAIANANKVAEGFLFSKYPELAGAEADQTIRAFRAPPRQEQRSLRN